MSDTKTEMPTLPVVDRLPFNLPEEYVFLARGADPADRWGADSWGLIARWLCARNVAVVTAGPEQIGLDPKGVVALPKTISTLQSAEVARRSRLSVASGGIALHAAPRSVLVPSPRTRPETTPPGTRVATRRSVEATLDAVADELGLNREAGPLLSVCLIVRNEAAGIEDAIRSVEGLADEVVVLNTESTDDTVAVAEGLGARVGSYDPGMSFDDFAAARNAAFDLARGRYVMWLDAGDRVKNPKPLRALLEEGGVDGVALDARWNSIVWERERVVPRWCARFVDRVHETINTRGLVMLTVPETHIRHVTLKKVNREDSLKRNARLLRMMMRESPDHPRSQRWRYYLARETEAMGRKEEALDLYVRQASGRGGWDEEKMLSALGAARIHLERGEYRAARDWSFRAMELQPGWREPFYVISETRAREGRLRISAAWLSACAQIPRPDVKLPLWEDLYVWLPLKHLARIEDRLGERDKAMVWASQWVGASSGNERKLAEAFLARVARGEPGEAAKGNG